MWGNESILQKSLETGNIYINENGYVTISMSCIEILPAFDHGGMKVFYDIMFPIYTMKTAASGNVRIITFDDGIEIS
jgi:hypothetical protein